ncbi:hypothetical protein C0Q70_00131 [Pomacea canaliculata]|uniref:C-type lectin domain-containing protein n=1 Tax=Pomacea canaliculata TaxID=400727 RepID=A0A2T7PVX4_POMCA|nr:hypothetical protein C0Q70_00131 [Pomacea canaliculata]
MAVPEWTDTVVSLAYLLCVAHTVLRADTLLVPKTNFSSDTNVSDRRSQLPILAEENKTVITGSRQQASWNPMKTPTQGTKHTKTRRQARSVRTSLNISKPGTDVRGPLTRPPRKASPVTNTGRCADSKNNMKSKGNITFTSGKDADMTWTISVHSSCHLVLQVQKLYFNEAENPSLSFNFTTEFSPTVHVKHYRSSVPFPLPPVFIRASTVQVRITTSQPRSRVDITYAAYLSSVLPPETEEGKYNCSPPYTIPAVLKCDMVEQCLGGEDEKDCPYKSKNCEANWLQAGFHCLLFRFPTNGLSIMAAEDECQSMYGAELAALQDAECSTLAARVLLLHGFTEAAVGLRRARTVNVFTQSMYRFLWQWNTDSTVVFSSLHRSIHDLYYECATIHVSGIVNLKAEDCLSVWRVHICDKKIKNDFSPTPIKRPALSSSLAWKIPLTKCADGTFVHVFHTCSTVEHQSSIPKFRCCNGIKVHYAVTCNGIDDCGDKCDERFCKTIAAHRLVKATKLKCLREFQLVRKGDRCDGKVDCYDLTDEQNCERCSNDLIRCRELGCLHRKYLHFFHNRFNLKHLCLSELTNETQEKPTTTTIYDLFLPDIIELDGYGMVGRRRLSPGEKCPSTHIQCNNGRPLKRLKCLNLRENKIEDFGENSLKGFENLQILETDDRRLCCLFETQQVQQAGRPLPNDLSVWFAIFVLPLNFALDPFLYTLNSVIDKWNQRRKEEAIKRTQSRLRAQLFSWPMATVIHLLHDCKSARNRALAASRRTNEDFNSGTGVSGDFSELQGYRHFTPNRKKINKFDDSAPDEIQCRSAAEFENRSLSLSTYDNSIYGDFEEPENRNSPASADYEYNNWLRLASPGSQSSPSSRLGEGKRCRRLDNLSTESECNSEVFGALKPVVT